MANLHEQRHEAECVDRGAECLDRNSATHRGPSATVTR